MVPCNSVSIVNDYGLNDCRSIASRNRIIFFLTAATPVLGSTQPHVQSPRDNAACMLHTHVLLRRHYKYVGLYSTVVFKNFELTSIFCTFAFEVLALVNFFLPDMTSRSMVEVYRRFGRT
jgi:hypothetical protein